MTADTDDWTEQDYCNLLEHERHLFAWCLQTYGQHDPARARAIAEEFYVFEPPSAPSRGLVFHDEAWHWAMLRIFGDGYWRTYSQLATPNADYYRESEAFQGREDSSGEAAEMVSSPRQRPRR